MAIIPASVQQLLNQQWEIKDHSTFEDIFREDAQRREYPSYYHIRTGQEVETELDVFSYVEAKALVEENVFGNLAISNSGGLSINEHAQHALSDFLSEVYAAWKRYEERLAEVERVGTFPHNN